MVYYSFFFLFIGEALFFKWIQQGLEGEKLRGHLQRAFNKSFLTLSGTELLLLYMLRALPNDTVHDLGRYVSFFFDISYGAEYTYLEPGFRLYMYLCSFINNTSEIYVLFTFAAPVIVITFWFIYKCSKNVYLSAYIYYGFMFYFFLFNGVRQCLAMAIGLPAFYFINERKWIKALIFILGAISFHYSAAILLVLFILKKIRVRINFSYFIIITISSFAMIGIANVFTGLITSLFASNYSGYLENATEGNWANPIMYLIIIGIICFLNRGMDREKEILLINSVALGTVIYFMSTQVQVLNRMAYYFTIPVICVLPNIISEIEDYRIRFLALVGCYAAITGYGMLLVLSNAHGILPYELNI